MHEVRQFVLLVTLVTVTDLNLDTGGSGAQAHAAAGGHDGARTHVVAAQARIAAAQGHGSSAPPRPRRVCSWLRARLPAAPPAPRRVCCRRARPCVARKRLTALPRVPAGRSLDATMISPPLMLHRTRVDKMTIHDNECNEAWDREWTASPTYERVSSPWKPSLGKTSQEFLSDSRTAGTRAEKKQLLDMARRAEKEEKAHRKLETFLDKTSRYSDRSRFRCIGTPLMTRDERQSMTLRSSGRLSLNQVQSCIQTPVCDTHHRFEAPGRGEAVLDRHKAERPAFLNG